VFLGKVTILIGQKVTDQKVKINLKKKNYTVKPPGQKVTINILDPKML
jgi:hypothetical protein